MSKIPPDDDKQPDLPDDDSETDPLPPRFPQGLAEARPVPLRPGSLPLRRGLVWNDEGNTILTGTKQAGKKESRRVARRAKAAAVAPRPVDKLRPVVRCP